MIDKLTEQKILDTANVEDVLRNYGVDLIRSGKDYTCHSPFRDDRHTGSFKVSPSRNIVSDFASNENWNAKELVAMFEYGRCDDLTVKEHYPDILKILAAMYRIYVDDSPPPTQRQFVPRPPAPPLQLQMWHSDIIKPFRAYNEQNPLIVYLRQLPLREVDRERLMKGIKNYLVSTYPQTEDKQRKKYGGWSIWWYVDHLGYVRTGKMMKYKTDGHRDKDAKPNFTWTHSLMAKWKTDRDGNEYEDPRGTWDNHTHETRLCLFGQHLLDFFPNAVIRLVESEKTALICSAFTDMAQVIWMATGGLSNMKDDRLLPLLEKGRTIELFPDLDGYDEWTAHIKKYKTLSPYIDNGMLRVSEMVKKLWTEADGPKADIADIMIRIVTSPTETEGMKAAAKLGHPDKAGLLDQLINQLDLI